MSKYNSEKVIIDGLTFDSKVEGLYYEFLKGERAQGRVKSFDVQPKFVLQPSFRKDGVHYRAITYSADFRIEYPDGTIEVVDIKGMETAIFNLKQKMFEHNFPEHKLTILKYSPLDGGFVSPKVHKEGVAKRKIERAEKKAEKERLKKEKLDKKKKKEYDKGEQKNG